MNQDYRKCNNCEIIHPINNFRKIPRKGVVYHARKCKSCIALDNKVKDKEYKSRREENS